MAPLHHGAIEPVRRLADGHRAARPGYPPRGLPERRAQLGAPAAEHGPCCDSCDRVMPRVGRRRRRPCTSDARHAPPRRWLCANPGTTRRPLPAAPAGRPARLSGAPTTERQSRVIPYFSLWCNVSMVPWSSRATTDCHHYAIAPLPRRGVAGAISGWPSRAKSMLNASPQSAWSVVLRSSASRFSWFRTSSGT